MNRFKIFLNKQQIWIFFFFSLLLGYWPWYILGEPIWFMYGMPITGFILVALTQGKTGILNQLKSAIRFKTKPRYYIEILAILITIASLTLLLSWLLFGDKPSFAMIKNETSSIPIFLLFCLIGGPILEELFGLRGYALPTLLKKFSPLISSIIIGTFFGAWHLIEFFRPGSSQYAIGLKLYPLFILTEIAVSIMMTHFFIKSEKNLWLAGIFFHWMMNNISVLFLSDITLSNINNAPAINPHYFVIQSILTILLALLFVIKGKMYSKT